MLHPAIQLRTSDIAGKGIAATAVIAKGTVLWSTTMEELEPLYTRKEIATWPEQQQHEFFALAYQIGDDVWSGPLGGMSDDPADYMNHSCDPTGWFVDDVTIAARRDIQPGEEITYDYATSQIDPTYGFACHCGAATCRGVMNGADWSTKPELRRQYGSHAMQHVLRSSA